MCVRGGQDINLFCSLVIQIVYLMFYEEINMYLLIYSGDYFFFGFGSRFFS